MMYPPQPPKKSGVLGRLAVSLLTTVFIASLVFNLYAFILYSASLQKSVVESTYEEGDGSARIVIMPVTGLIDESTSQFYREALKELEADPPQAIVLRIDSGGGYVGPSDRVWHNLKEFKARHDVPIVASFGGVAASGAYYIAAAADTIVMEPTGLTGSIGVISQAFTFPDMLDKVGVTPEIVVSPDSPLKDEFSPFRPWTEKDRAAMQDILSNAYATFFEVVYEGRKGKMSKEELEAVANGAVYTADQAIDNKLVDKVGYLAAAIDEAKALAKIPAGTQPLVTTLDRPAQISLLGLLSSHAPSTAVSFNPEDLSPEQVRGWMMEMGTPRLTYHISP